MKSEFFKPIRWRVGALVLALGCGSATVFAQTTVVWDGGSGGNGTGWITAENWVGDVVPGTTDIAQFGAAGTAGTVGINMNGATNNGANNQAVGAIEITPARTTGLSINNSSTTAAGTLTLNGATVNGNANVIVRNTNVGLIITNGSSQAMGLALGNATNNVIRVDGGGSIVIFSAISGANRTLTFAGSGSGALTLAGPNVYSGVTQFDATGFGATLRIAHASALGTSTLTMLRTGNIDNFSGGPLAVSNNIALSGGSLVFQGSSDLSFGNNTVAMSNAGRSITVNFGTLTVGSVTEDAPSRSFTKIGAGTLVLLGNSTYTGNTAASGGTLHVQTGANISNTSSVNVASGATLRVDGSVTTTGDVTINGTGVIIGNGTVTAAAVVVGSAASLAPGGSVGTVDIDANLDLAGTLSIEYDDSLTGQKIDEAIVTGDLDISAGTISFSDISSGSVGLSQMAYVFAKYSTLTGPAFANVINLPPGYSIDYDYDDGMSTNNIALIITVVPEASAFLFGALAFTVAGVGKIVARRRRPKSEAC
jgi:autotransporter-associated beta strand protein